MVIKYFKQNLNHSKHGIYCTDESLANENLKSTSKRSKGRSLWILRHKNRNQSNLWNIAGEDLLKI